MKRLNITTAMTGDIVNSRAMRDSDLARAFERLTDAADMIAALQDAPLHFSRHRGDGWQIVLSNPRLYLRTALLFRATLRSLGAGVDTYLAAANQTAHALSENTDLNTQTSPALVASGALLDTIKDIDDFDLPIWAHEAGGAHGATLIFADAVSRGWTPAQACAAYHVLATKDVVTYTSLAKRLGKSRQAVTKSLRGAKIDYITTALAALED